MTLTDRELEIAAELRRRRLARGYRLVEVAALAGTTASALSMVERGRQRASLDVLATYHRLFRWGIR